MDEGLSRLARLRVPFGFAAGIVTLVLSTPRPGTVLAGTAIALVGEAIRVWAAGHLEKSREVTTSGPYRFTRHPLYVGSAVMAGGVAVASASVWVALVVAVYFTATVTAAIRTEEAFLRSRFGAAYDEYCRGTGAGGERPFSWERVFRNREWRALVGLGAMVGLLAAKMLVIG